MLIRSFAPGSATRRSRGSMGRVSAGSKMAASEPTGRECLAAVSGRPQMQHPIVVPNARRHSVAVGPSRYDRRILAACRHAMGRLLSAGQRGIVPQYQTLGYAMVKIVRAAVLTLTGFRG